MVSIAGAIGAGLFFAFVQSLGLTLQRKSHLENADLRLRDWQRPTWVIGFLIFIVSNTLGSVFQLGALPIVVLAPLGGVSLIWNAIFAKLILGDTFSRYLVLGTVLIAGGAVLIAVFGTTPIPNHDLAELLLLYGRPAFIAWVSVLSFLMLLVLAASHTTEWSLNRRHHHAESGWKPRARRWSEPVRSDALLKSIGTVPSPVATTVLRETDAALTRTRLWIGIAYGSVSGTLSGLCLLFAKTGTELLILTALGTNQFKRWQSYVIVAVLLVAAILQLWYLNRSLRLLGPTLICPLAFCFYNLSSILNGLFFYDQWRLLSAARLTLMSLGILVLLVGVWIVSLKSDEPSETDEEDGFLSERTPLMSTAEPDSYSNEVDLEEGEVARLPPSGLESFKRMLLESPAGLAIGIAAPSPGFAVRPQHHHYHHGRRATTDHSLASSTHSLPERSHHRASSLTSSYPNSPTSPTSEFGGARHPIRSKRRSLGNAFYVGLDMEALDAVELTPPPPPPPVETERKPTKGGRIRRFVGL